MSPSKFSTTIATLFLFLYALAENILILSRIALRIMKLLLNLTLVHLLKWHRREDESTLTHVVPSIWVALLEMVCVLNM